MAEDDRDGPAETRAWPGGHLPRLVRQRNMEPLQSLDYSFDMSTGRPSAPAPSPRKMFPIDEITDG